MYSKFKVNLLSPFLWKPRRASPTFFVKSSFRCKVLISLTRILYSKSILNKGSSVSILNLDFNIKSRFQYQILISILNLGFNIKSRFQYQISISISNLDCNIKCRFQYQMSISILNLGFNIKSRFKCQI